VTVIPLSHAAELRGAVRERYAALRAQGENLDRQELLRLALEAFPAKIAIISAFAAESVVLLHQVAEIDPTTPILFLNTHKLFGETMR